MGLPQARMRPLEDGDSVGEVFGFVEVVGGQHDRRPDGAEVLDHLPAVERAWSHVEAAPRIDQLTDPQVQREPALLEHDTGPRSQLWGVSGRVEAEDTYGTGVGFTEALEDLDRGRLAGLVGSEQGEHLAPSHREIDPVEYRSPAVALVQAGDIDRHVRGGYNHVAKIRLCI
jgi:hypothetical protein